MERNYYVNVLIKKTPRATKSNFSLYCDFKKIYQTKKFLDYLARLSANISLDSKELHQKWNEYPDKTSQGFKNFLKNILKEQKLSAEKIKPKLFQILDKDKTAIVDLKTAKENIGEIKEDQAVYPYIISFKNYDLVAQNNLMSLEDYAEFIAPELTKWLKKNFLDINNLNIYGAVHFDTDHPHIQLWISEKNPTVKHDKTLRFDKRDKFEINRRDFELELETKLLKGFRSKTAQIQEKLITSYQENELDQQILDLRNAKIDYLENLKKFNIEDIKNTKEMEMAKLVFSSEDQEKLYSLIGETREAKKITSLTLSNSFVSTAIYNLSWTVKEQIKNLFGPNSSKYYKFLKPAQKKIVDDVYLKVLQVSSRLKLKEKQEHFENLLNKIKEFKNHKDPVIANKARTISAKEEREYFLSSRNFILKKIREAFSIGKKQYPVIRGTDREPVWEPEPYWAYTFNKWRKKFSR